MNPRFILLLGIGVIIILLYEHYHTLFPIMNTDKELFHVTLNGHMIEGVMVLRGTPNFPFYGDNRWVRHVSFNGLRVLKYTGGRCQWFSGHMKIHGTLYAGSYMDETGKGFYTVYVACHLDSVVPKHVKGDLLVENVPKILVKVNPRVEFDTTIGKTMICISSLKEPVSVAQVMMLSSSADVVVLYTPSPVYAYKVVVISPPSWLNRAKLDARMALYTDCTLRAKINGFERVINVDVGDTIKGTHNTTRSIRLPVSLRLNTSLPFYLL